jgi:hypothetical protein
MVGVALVLASGASAKFGMSLSLSGATPRVHEPVRATILAETRVGTRCDMRLVAVPPGVGTYESLAALESRQAHWVDGPNGPVVRYVPLEPRFGFLARIVRTGPKTWRATMRFPRRGTWRLVIPNWCAPGYATPPPVARSVVVR